MTTDPWPFPGLKPAHYGFVLLDPPWFMSGGTKSRPQHYKRMLDREIAAIPLHLLARPEGCWFGVWITSPMNERFWQKVRPGWKLRYSARGWVWIKTHRRLRQDQRLLFVHPDSIHRGTGYTTRKNAEDLLLFKVGRPPRLVKDEFEVIFSPPREHSRKPDESYERIERFALGPYAELFCRSGRANWDSWGDEVGKFPAAERRAA